MSDINPFFNRGPVRDPAYFFGRHDEINFISELLRAGQSVSLSGPRRFGKTSLLYHLANSDISTLDNPDSVSTRWVYIDGGMLDRLDVEWFYGAVERALGGEVDAVPYSRFVETVRALASQNLRLILTLDEFELIAANPHFGPTLFNHLRGLAGQFPLQFVTASRAPLGKLTFAHQDTLSSPFFNIFAPVQLALFSQSEATDLLATLSARHGRPFAAETVAFLLKLAGPHPLFLQVAGYRAFAAVDQDGVLSDEIRARVRSQVQADLEPHLLYYWNNLDSEAQYTLAALPLVSPDAPSSLRQPLQTAGLLDQGHYLGEALKSFVHHQAVDGLLQSGSFLLDTRRGLAAAYDQPLHLTPTEFAAFKLFLENPGQVITPDDIEAALWPDEISPDPGRARGIVKKLRAALGPASEAIVNRRGQGWLLETGDLDL